LYGRSPLTEHEIGQCSRCATVKAPVSWQTDQRLNWPGRGSLALAAAAGHDALSASLMITVDD